MRIPGLKCVRLGARWFRSRFVNGALILGYHRIAESENDPFGICVTPQRFSQQIEILRQYANPISLEELAQGLENGKLPRRAVAITFDDGYADSLYFAKPLLTHYEIPATVFVATGYLDREFWWDELQELLYSPKSLPAHLALTLNAHTREWALGSGASPETRGRLLLSLCDFFRPMSEGAIQDGMSQIRSWAGSKPGARSGHRVLNPDEVIELAEGDLVDIGAHTVTHPVLSGLPISKQRVEIEESKAVLGQILGRPVSNFSYPNGSLSSDTISLVEQAGFKLACMSTSDVAWRGSNRFKLPRFWVQDWEGETFLGWLKRWT